MRPKTSLLLAPAVLLAVLCGPLRAAAQGVPPAAPEPAAKAAPEAAPEAVQEGVAQVPADKPAEADADKPPAVDSDAPQPIVDPEAPSPLDFGGHGTESFVKGELASVGAIGMVPWENRFGVVLGLERLGNVFYLDLKPEVNYTDILLGRRFSSSFGIPIRLQMLDSQAEDRWGNVGYIRVADWNNWRQYAQVIRSITWGSKERHFFLNVTQFDAFSIGHGTILKRYSPNLDMNQRRVSFEVDAFSDWAGGEVFLDDITGPNVVGALVFLKPLSFIDNENWMMRSFSIGGTFLADVNAPLRNRLDYADVNNDGRRWTQLEVDSVSGQPSFVKTTVLAWGVDAELKVVDQDGIDYKTYVDYSFLESGVPTDDTQSQAPSYQNIPTRKVMSSGFTWGNLLRVNLGTAPIHALRVRAEYRHYMPNYLPSYFDVGYQIDRVAFGEGNSRQPGALANMTKVQQVLGRDSGGPWVDGGYLELSYRVGDYFAMAVGVEMNSRTPDNSLFVHVEVPQYKGWQFLATYHRRHADGAKNLFRWFQSGGTDYLVGTTRYQFFKWFAMSLEAVTPFSYTTDSTLRSALEMTLNLEFGYPFQVAREEK